VKATDKIQVTSGSLYPAKNRLPVKYKLNHIYILHINKLSESNKIFD